MKLIEEKSWAFAIRIIRLYEYLCEKKKFYKLAEQLLRSGTSIGQMLQKLIMRKVQKIF